MPPVIVYTTPACPYCAMVKAFLEQHGIPFVEKNVADDRVAATEMMQKSSQMSVPVLDIGGRVIVGFNRDTLKKALKLP